MNPFGQGFPEPLQSVINHAERFSIALLLAERDQAIATGLRELSLRETWVIGRAGEVESFVEDVVYAWRAGAFTVKSAAAAIEVYLRTLHRCMHDKTALGGATCCASANECVTVDFSTADDVIAKSYPREALPARLPRVMPPPMVVARIVEASPSPEAKANLSRLTGTVEIRL